MEGDPRVLIGNQAVLVYSWSKVMLEVLKENLFTSMKNLLDSIDYHETFIKRLPLIFSPSEVLW